MDCTSFKEHAAMFALGSLSPEEHAACAEHLATVEQHEGCLESLHEAMAAVAALDEAPSPPPPRVWERIEATLEPQTSLLRSARQRAWGAAAVALVAAAAAVLLWTRVRRVERQLDEARQAAAREEQETLAATQARDSCLERVKGLEGTSQVENGAVALLQLPGTQLFPLKANAGAPAQKTAANAIMHTGVKRAYVIAEGLSTVANHDYEMWIAKGTRVVPVGVITVDDQGRGLIRVDYASFLGDVGAPDAMMITLEPHAGDLKVPGPTVLFGKPQA